MRMNLSVFASANIHLFNKRANIFLNFFTFFSLVIFQVLSISIIAIFFRNKLSTYQLLGI